MPTPVAYGCHLTSTIDYVHFIALLPLNGPGTISITSAKSQNIVRGNSPITRLMRNCGIICVQIVDGDRVMEATIKIFKQYLHFCRVNEEQANLLADFTCNLLREVQRTIENDEKRRDYINSLEHLTTDSEREATYNYFGGHNVCSSDLDHDCVSSTMINHSISIGSEIHTALLAKLLAAKCSQWSITYDNALSLAIRVRIPDEDGRRHAFTIHPSGNVLYSARNTEEIEESRKELLGFILSHLDQIRL